MSIESITEEEIKLDFSNRYYQLSEDYYSYQLPTEIDNPFLIHFNEKMANEIEIDSDRLIKNSNFKSHFTRLFSGNSLFEQSEPIASIYAGHQFGHFVPQLGDGRAILLGEIKTKNNNFWELQLKGAGPTPYSRRADGRAVLRSSIREYLCAEAMHGLGIPTTRSLCLIGSHEEVYRENLEKGAVVTRLSPSFIRFGSFELFASRGQDEQVKKLADFVIDNYYPQAKECSFIQKKLHKNKYQHFLTKVVNETAKLMAKWQAVGFSHGVMNTDNMSILSLTIDYGPFGFLDEYEPDFICNHSDHQGRYSFKNQPEIGLWNLTCLAQSLLSLMTIDEAKESLAYYETIYNETFQHLMCEKLGLFSIDEMAGDFQELVQSLLKILAKNKVDYSIFFRALSAYIPETENKALKDMFIVTGDFEIWSKKYSNCLLHQEISDKERALKMNQVNPKFILRNYIAQMVIEESEKQEDENGDYSLLENVMTLLQSPYDEHPDKQVFANYPPQWAKKISVSCSS